MIAQLRNGKTRHRPPGPAIPNHNFMKIFIVTPLIILFAILNIFAQPEANMERFEKLSSQEALDLYMDSNEPPRLQSNMIRSAFRNKRTDLITMLFKRHPSFNELFKILNEMPGSDYKNSIVVIMLRTDSGFWYRPAPPLAYDGFRGVEFENAIEPFVGVIGKYLPSLPINQELFATKENRMKLAGDLEVAMAKANASSVKEVVPPETQTEAPPPASVVPPTNSKSNPENENENLPAAPERQLWSNPILVAAIAFGMTGLLWLAYKLRRSDHS